MLELAQTVRQPRLTMLAQDPEGHGVALLREPAVRRAILDWLRLPPARRGSDDGGL